MPRIILLKTPPTSAPTPSPVQNDPYRSQFENAGYEVDYVPVLKEEYRTEELSRLLLGSGEYERAGDGDGVGWAGVVITSKRGAEGWIKAAKAVEASSTKEDKLTDWTNIPLFTVGSTALDHLSTSQHATRPELRLRLRTDIVKTAKSAIDLLPVLTSYDQSYKGRYLIIRGDKSTNELQAGLSKVGIKYLEVGVYTTSARVDLSSNLEVAIWPSTSSSALSPSLSVGGNQRNQTGETWMAFFSPSSAELVLPLLGDRLVQYRVAAIGGTTEKHLRERGVMVEAVAEQPTAEGLLEAIQACREEGT